MICIMIFFLKESRQYQLNYRILNNLFFIFDIKQHKDSWQYGYITDFLFYFIKKVKFYSIFVGNVL